MIERIIERIVPQGGTISASTLTAILADFEQSISSRIAALNPPPAAIPAQVAASGNAGGSGFFPASQRIDQLTNTAINTPTINSPTISGGTISNAAVSGTLSGTFSGTSSFTAATTSSLAISSIPWGLLSTDGSGNIVATSTPTAAAFIATSTIASQFPYASSTALTVTGTGFFGTASSSALVASNSFTFKNVTGFLKATAGVVATSLINLTSDVTGILPIANGGTATSTQVTNGVNYYDGTRITSGTSLTFDGTTLTAPRGAFSATSGTTTITSGQGFTIGGSQFVMQQGSGNVGIGTASPTSKLHLVTVSNATIANDVSDTGSAAISWVQNTTDGNFVQLSARGSTVGGTSFGLSRNGIAEILLSPTTASVGAIGTISNAPLVLASNNAERLRIDTSGNIGIGTTTPWGKLSVTGTGTGTGLAFAVADSANTPRFVIQDNGNVGIGTTSPAYPLDVKNDGVSIVGRLLSANTSATYLSLNNNSIGGHDWWIGSTGSVNGMGVGKLAIYDQTTGMPRLLIDGSGNVGIGTTSPVSTLAVSGGAVTVGASSYLKFQSSAGGGSGEYWIGHGGATGAGTLAMYAPSGSGLEFGIANAGKMIMDTNGHVGVGATPLSNVQLYVVADSNTDYAVYGTAGKTTGYSVVGVSQNGANSGLLGYANNWGIYCVGVQCGGNVAWTNNSDVRLKTAIADIDASSTLASLMRLRPVTYHWKDAAIDAGRGEQLGFIAQEVEPLFPDLVTKGASTTITLADGSKETVPDPKALDYSGFVVPLVKAVQEIASIGSTFKANLIAWLGDASNGIGKLFAHEIRGDILCAGNVCVDEQQLAALLVHAGQTAAAPSTNALLGELQAPVIELNGNASSTIEVGNTYNDLGARIVAPESDLNLGIVIVLDGSTTTVVSLDTTTPGEHTILYTVTSPTTGLTGSVMRSIIISPAEQQADPPANDNASATVVVDVAA